MFLLKPLHTDDTNPLADWATVFLDSELKQVVSVAADWSLGVSPLDDLLLPWLSSLLVAPLVNEHPKITLGAVAPQSFQKLMTIAGQNE